MDTASGGLASGPRGRRIANRLRGAGIRGDVVSVTTLAGGKTNSNALIPMSGQTQPIVPRVFLRDPAACARELGILRAMRHHIPVPELLAHRCDETGQPCLIDRYVQAKTRLGPAVPDTLSSISFDPHEGLGSLRPERRLR